MSGLIGKFSFDPQEPLARPVLEQMLDAARPCLPERLDGVARSGSGRDIFQAPGIAIGVAGEARDLTIAAHEFPPLRAAAHAELANAAALRHQLAALGYTFTTDADSEVMLAAYAQWGTGAFRRFRGPFACAIWDAMNRRLVLARDHVGIRPLYFALLPNHGLVFASEIRSLVCDPGVPRDWCATAIDAYLALGYVPAPLTAYRRISKLEAGSFLVIEGRRFHVERYWDLPAAETQPARTVVAGIAADVRRVMTDQAADGLVHGLLYSGGVGSTTLLASAPSTVSTIVSVAMGADGDELARSDRAAAHLGYLCEIEGAQPKLPRLAREMAALCDEPVADPAAVSHLALCIAARRQTDVAFAATGAATLWGGHPRHRHPRPLQDTNGRRALYTRAFAWDVRDVNPLARHLELELARDTSDPIDRALYVDAHTFLPDSELVVAEHAAAAAGLRLRYPLLDPDLVARAATTPGTLKQHGGADMYALRLVLGRSLPAALLPPARRSPARHAWLDPALAALVPAVLLSPRFDGRGIVSRPALRHLWDEHVSGRHDHGHRLWALLMLEFWFRDSIDGDAAEEPVEYAVLKAA